MAVPMAAPMVVPMATPTTPMAICATIHAAMGINLVAAPMVILMTATMTHTATMIHMKNTTHTITTLTSTTLTSTILTSMTLKITTTLTPMILTPLIYFGVYDEHDPYEYAIILSRAADKHYQNFYYFI